MYPLRPLAFRPALFLTFLVLSLTASPAIAQNQAPSAAFLFPTEGAGWGDNDLPAASGLYFLRHLAGNRVQKAILSR